MPLRNYLMQHVMPTLTEGLIEACKIKPDDPIDFLVSLDYFSEDHNTDHKRVSRSTVTIIICILFQVLLMLCSMTGLVKRIGSGGRENFFY